MLYSLKDTDKFPSLQSFHLNLFIQMNQVIIEYLLYTQTLWH